MPSAPPPLVAELDKDLDWESRSLEDVLRETLLKELAQDSYTPTVVSWGDDKKVGDGQHARTTGSPCEGLPCYDRRFVSFAVQGNTVFKVTSKYGAPIGYIGGGAYGTVCYAFDSEKGMEVAIKKITNAFADVSQAKLALREVMLLRQMIHPNLISLTDIVPPQQREIFNDLYISTERMDSDMHKIIQSTKALIPEHCKWYSLQILCGMKYLHSQDVIHRDLKPQNLLVSKDHVVKICDFGQARAILRNDPNMTRRVGTLAYQAPELILYARAYSKAVDVWSIGCIIVEFVLGKTLFPGGNDEEQMNLIFELLGTPAMVADLSFLDGIGQSFVRGHTQHQRQPLTEKYPEMDPLLADLAQKMLVFDPRERITTEEALAHPYFKDLHAASTETVCHTPSPLDFDEQKLSVEKIKDLIYEEALAFNPTFRQEGRSRKEEFGRNHRN